MWQIQIRMSFLVIPQKHFLQKFPATTIFLVTIIGEWIPGVKSRRNNINISKTIFHIQLSTKKIIQYLDTLQNQNAWKGSVFECWKFKWVLKILLIIPRPLSPKIHQPIIFTKKNLGVWKSSKKSCVTNLNRDIHPGNSWPYVQKDNQDYSVETRPGDLVICRTHWDKFVVKIFTIFYHFRHYKSGLWALPL